MIYKVVSMEDENVEIELNSTYEEGAYHEALTIIGYKIVAIDKPNILNGPNILEE